MASPQVENGHTKLANELVEQFSKVHFSGNEWLILWTVIRKTYGWNKISDAISISQFEKVTGLSRPSVSEALKKLVGKKVLVVVGKKVLVTEYSLNKNYEEWTSREKGTSRVFGSQLVPKKVPKLVPKRGHTKDNKDTIQKTIERTTNFLLTFEQLSELQERFHEADVKGEYNKALDWIAANGKTYKDYSAFFRNWLRRVSGEKESVPVFLTATDGRKFYSKDELLKSIKNGEYEIEDAHTRPITVRRKS